ncbi:MAG: response regulator, partial [Chromatiales bacterium]
VNAEEPTSLVTWIRHREGLPAGCRVPPSIIVTTQREFNTKHPQLVRPLMATRVIGILDSLATKVLNIEEVAAIADVPAAEPAPSMLTGHGAASASASLRALVVDDSLPVRVQINRVLKPYVDRIDFAETGEEALNLVAQHRYDIIFLDVVLPGADGYEVCQTIKDGSAAQTPVIMLTSNSSPADRIKGKLAGCDTYLIKPVGHDVFNAVVGQLLHRRPTVVAQTG